MKVNYFDLFNKHQDKYHHDEDKIPSILERVKSKKEITNCSINDLILDHKYGFIEIFNRECRTDFCEWLRIKGLGYGWMGREIYIWIDYEGKKPLRVTDRPELLLELKAKYILETMEK